MAMLLYKTEVPGVGTSVGAEEILEEWESAWARQWADFVLTKRKKRHAKAGGWFEQMCKGGTQEAAWLSRG